MLLSLPGAQRSGKPAAGETHRSSAKREDARRPRRPCGCPRAWAPPSHVSPRGAAGQAGDAAPPPSPRRRAAEREPRRTEPMEDVGGRSRRPHGSSVSRPTPAGGDADGASRVRASGRCARRRARRIGRAGRAQARRRRARAPLSAGSGGCSRARRAATRAGCAAHADERRSTTGCFAALDSPRTMRVVSMTIWFHEPYSN